MIEDAQFIADHSIQHPAVNHHATIPARREHTRGERSVDEVKVRRARVLVQAERQLELAAPHLHEVELLVVGVDVSPGVLPFEFPIDLECQHASDLAFDPDPPAREVRFRIV